MPGTGQRSRAGMFASQTNWLSSPALWSRVGNQVRAAAEGALDTATFGIDDQVAAGAHAVGDWFHGKPIGAAYKQRIAQQHKSDADDARLYGTARTLGTIGATGLELLLPGGAIGAAARLASKAKFLKAGGKAAEAIAHFAQPVMPAAKRIAQVTKLSGKEGAAVGVVGGVAGAGGQAASDLMHHKRSSWRDYAGAAAGGSAEALAALRGNPKLAAAVGGATTSLAQDALNGRALSPSDAAKSAYASAILARAVGAVGTAKAEAASIKTKEWLGERGSRLRTNLNRDWTYFTKKERYHLEPIDGYSKGYTYPDQRTGLGKLIESKFGKDASLTPRQTQAYLQLGDHYRVDHFLPKDVGSLAGFGASQLAHNSGRSGVPDFDPAAFISPLPRFDPGLPPYLG